MSEKKNDAGEKKVEESTPIKPSMEIPKEDYWSFMKVAREAVKFLDNTLYPTLEKRGVSKESIATIYMLFAVSLQDVMITQMALMRTGIEPTVSLSQVEKAVNEIYKQYSSGAITPKDAIDALFSIFSSLTKKTGTK